MEFKRAKLRRLLYKEITWVYGELRGLQQKHERWPGITSLTHKTLEQVLQFDHYKHALSMPDIYNDLPDHLYSDFIYRQYKRLMTTDDEEEPLLVAIADTPEVRLAAAISAVDRIVTKNALNLRIIEKVCSPYLKDHFRSLAFRVQD